MCIRDRIIIIITQLFKGILLKSLLFQILYNLLWTILISWICQKGFQELSWFLVILPILIVPLLLNYVNKKSDTSTGDEEDTTNEEEDTTM